MSFGLENHEAFVFNIDLCKSENCVWGGQGAATFSGDYPCLMPYSSATARLYFMMLQGFRAVFMPQCAGYELVLCKHSVNQADLQVLTGMRRESTLDRTKLQSWRCNLKAPSSGLSSG
jgi:hypothetical protein